MTHCPSDPELDTTEGASTLRGRVFGSIGGFLRRHKRIAPLFVALAAIPAAIGIQANIASAQVWVQQRWDLTQWGSVQTLRDADASNHWKFVWYAPGDGVPSFISNELWLGAPCNGGVVVTPGTGNGYGSGTALWVQINQLWDGQYGGRYTCVAPQDGRWTGTGSFVESNNTCAGYYTEGSISSVSTTSIVTSNYLTCNDGGPATVDIDIGGYNG